MTAKDIESKGASPRPAGPVVLPLRHALTICGAALVLGVSGFAAAVSAGSMAATTGFAVGLFAALSAGQNGAMIAGLGFIAAAGLVVAFRSCLSCWPFASPYRHWQVSRWHDPARASRSWC